MSPAEIKRIFQCSGIATMISSRSLVPRPPRGVKLNQQTTHLSFFPVDQEVNRNDGSRGLRLPVTHSSICLGYLSTSPMINCFPKCGYPQNPQVATDLRNDRQYLKTLMKIYRSLARIKNAVEDKQNERKKEQPKKGMESGGAGAEQFLFVLNGIFFFIPRIRPRLFQK